MLKGPQTRAFFYGLNVFCKLIFRPMKYLIALSLSLLLISCQRESNKAAKPNRDQLRQEVDHFLTAWHDDAAAANPDYFDKMAPNGVYLGTDKTERWTREEFRAWAEKYFQDGKGWDFNAESRHISFSANGETVWVDELLKTWMGTCRGSAVLTRRDTTWAIQLYHLSLTVPNDTLQTVMQTIEAFEEKQKSTP